MSDNIQHPFMIEVQQISYKRMLPQQSKGPTWKAHISYHSQWGKKLKTFGSVSHRCPFLSLLFNKVLEV